MTEPTFTQSVAEKAAEIKEATDHWKQQVDHVQMLIAEKNEEIERLKKMCRVWRDAFALAGNAAREVFGDEDDYANFFQTVHDDLGERFVINTWAEEAGKKIDVEVELEYEVTISGSPNVHGQDVDISVTDYVTFNTTLNDVPMGTDVSDINDPSEFCDFETDFSEENGDLTLEFVLQSISEN